MTEAGKDSRQKQYRVLIPCNRVPDNPYLFQLIRGLDGDPGVATVQHDTDWLRFPDSQFDIMHIQWPEALFGWREPSRASLDELERLLVHRRQQGSIVAVTVHNIHPHGRDTRAFRRLYSIVYGNADLFVHFGHRSVETLISQYPHLAKDRVHTVIPHGNYQWFLAKDGLVTPPPEQEPFVVLCFGRVRSRAEIVLIEAAADYLRPLGGEIHVVGRLPQPSRLSLARYRTRQGLWRRPNIRLVEGFVPDALVRQYMSQSHAVFIPRTEHLNSGNVALAFTFGRVAIGPDIGTIGEELKKLGNPTFDPSSPATIKEAMIEAVQLVRAGGGERNRQYAEEQLAWNRIAELHVEAYRQCDQVKRVMGVTEGCATLPAAY